MYQERKQFGKPGLRPEFGGLSGLPGPISAVDF
jgi:hypothetical protein